VITERFADLPRNRRRGSFPRCLLLTDGDRATVAARLTSLVAPFAAIDPTRHVWMPAGLDAFEEAKLGESPGFLTEHDREAVTAWWLAVRERANTPNWDIAATATVEGRQGLVLVEAKAHARELKADGKRPGRAENDARIGGAIAEANAALNRLTTGWTLSAAGHYQLANRFAWGWKLASLAIPVVLVYLGFVNATEMRDKGRPFADDEDWRAVLHAHADRVVPPAVWNHPLDVGGTPLIPLIRSACVALQPEAVA
jgi:hypothetical protein